MKQVKQRAFSVLGNIAIVNFADGVKRKGHRSVYPQEGRVPLRGPKALSFGAKKKFAQKILRENKAIKTVLEKSGKFSGRLRKMRTKFLAGEKTKEVLYKENGCVFRFNIDTTYFSPRLAQERKEIAEKIKKDDEVLVMFAGVAPYSIVIARNSKCKRVYSNEINREANKYAKLNIELNHLKNKVELVNGDVKKLPEKLKEKCCATFVEVQKGCCPSEIRGRSARKIKGFPRFDVIVMPRPNLKDTFLKQAFMLSKKGTRIYYYGFCKMEEQNLMVEQIKEEARIAKKKIKIVKTKIAGETAPYKIRLRVDLIVE